MSEMIERVARAIVFHVRAPAREFEDMTEDEYWERFKTESADFEFFMGQARAAIEEMRVATEAMIECGSANISPWWSPAMEGSGSYGDTRKAAASSWMGMIDAALSETPEHE